MYPLLKTLFRFLATTSFTPSGSLYAYHHSHEYPNTVNALLHYYGFETTEQKQALRYLMHQSGISDTDTILDHPFNNQMDLCKAILRFVSETQQHFIVRHGTQERWDVKTAEWMKDPTQHIPILAALKTLDMLDAIPPTLKNRDAICILGSTYLDIKTRLTYTKNLLKQKKLQGRWLILLTGERYLTPDKNGIYLDGNEQKLIQLANHLKKDLTELTETDLMKEAYNASLLHEKFQNRVALINTPKGHLPRPTTETTVTELCQWLTQHPNIQSITFISNQPYVAYQKAVIEHTFTTQNIKNIDIEVIGSPCKIGTSHHRAKAINDIIQDLGSRIWAATPNVLFALKFNIDAELQTQYFELYRNQPLIYNQAYY